jgi:hypothetical protein
VDVITSNPRAVIESCPQELFTAAGYPETMSIAAGKIQPGCPVTANMSSEPAKRQVA